LLDARSYTLYSCLRVVFDSSYGIASLFRYTSLFKYIGRSVSDAPRCLTTLGPSSYVRHRITIPFATLTAQFDVKWVRQTVADPTRMRAAPVFPAGRPAGLCFSFRRVRFVGFPAVAARRRPRLINAATDRVRGVATWPPTTWARGLVYAIVHGLSPYHVGTKAVRKMSRVSPQNPGQLNLNVFPVG